MPDDHFGELIAERYETYWPELYAPEVVDSTVDFLADLAGAGAALEFGVGTGRVALPLSRRGVAVHGIDLSPAMLAKLATYDGADAIGVTQGDFATTRVDRTFTHHYWVGEGQLETASAPFRYLWPGELDLMARIAGLRLRERYAGWDRAPFTSASRSHVSVWERPASA